MADSYDEKREAEDFAFAERIAASLRAPERAHPSFEKRVMDRVRAEGRSLYAAPGALPNTSWWRTEWIIRLSPRGGIAIAAGIAAIIALSGVAVGKKISAPSHESSRTARRWYGAWKAQGDPSMRLRLRCSLFPSRASLRP